ncbi:PREDICTED: uncharacterized protein LOC109359836 [Lupinus angustifolius]|uniref:uncharacterized protein LOC109359836 n=1 Tax=Lupinus angustifolius TaxID=3871 RepID=UPI00092F4A25|nr:PREDICTED: uncharacterized protein LOC109359836 [Lupinus angustifolius]
MEAKFDVTDLGKLNYFLGMEFSYTPTGLLMHQKKYASDLLQRFNMDSCNSVTSPVEANVKLTNDEDGEAVDETLFKQIVGSLRYLCNSIPHISYGVGLVSRFMCNPKETHMLLAKRILRYVKGTSDHVILFPVETQKSELGIVGFADSYYGGDLGYLFLLNNALISGCSKKQPVIALSGCKAEYISGCYAACQAIWHEKLQER